MRKYVVMPWFVWERGDQDKIVSVITESVPMGYRLVDPLPKRKESRNPNTLDGLAVWTAEGNDDEDSNATMRGLPGDGRG